MKLVFNAIGYLSTATIIALAAGLGYLWQTRQITNEKLFEMVALMHDVNLREISEEEEFKQREVPVEEQSLDEYERLREIKLRNYEVKVNALKQGRKEFDASFQSLAEATKRFDNLAKELEGKLKQQGELAMQQSLRSVVERLEAIKPVYAKEELLMYLKEPDGEQTVIMLLRSMTENKRAKVLQQFQTPEELQELHRINQLEMQGFPDKPEIDRLLERVRMQTDAGK
jgi:hypothetical protein